ncbi:MAG TPA: hypothetical protein PK272_06555, partial [Methanoregulaceae archaeon]|nr:hypothetical protein [Methanoregulaceae archaeon]
MQASQAQTAIPASPLTASPDALLREAFEAGELIKFAQEQINELQERRDKIIEQLHTRGIREAGNYEIMEKHRVTRKVNVQRFAARYPDAYVALMEEELRRAKMNAGKVVLIKDAERMLGKDQLDPVCDLQDSVSF